MLTRPDFNSRQVLVFESHKKRKLAFRNTNVVLLEDEKIIAQQSCHKIFLLVIIGEFSITSVLIRNLKKYRIPTVFYSYRLRPYHSVIPELKGNVLLRSKQYSCDNCLEIAKHLVKNKATNQIRLMRSLRYKTVEEKSLVNAASTYREKIDSCSSAKELLGIEGNISKIFFQVYFKNTGITGRAARCRRDIPNTLLDIGYTILFNYLEAQVELYGFDTYCGVYHTFFFQRKSLVCDLIEPFRYIIDRRLRKSYNLKQIDESDFGYKNDQYFLKIGSSKKYVRLFMKDILEHKEEVFLYIRDYYRAFMKGSPIDSYPVIGDRL